MITIHEAKASDFATLGLGALLPSECTVRERAGGMYELKIVHPITDDGRHQRIKPMRIIKAPAPVRETPLANTGGTTREIYRVATVDERLNMRTGPGMDYKVIRAYRPGTEVAKLETDGEWMQVAVLDGGAAGWMYSDNLEYVRTETEAIIGDAPGTVIQPRQTREQLFRIYHHSPDTKTRTVTAEAQHITYDLAGAVVDGEYSPENVPADQVCAQIMARADHDVSEFHIYCTVSTPISGEFGGRNILDCLLDPETGIVAQTKARIVRDNYDIFILPDEVRSRGVELRYGKNLLSAYMDTDVSDTITRIKPVGKDKNGEKLYVEENGGWVESPYISDYPVVYSKEVEYDVVESDKLPISEARALLKEKAEADFLAGCDMATVRLDADFVRLELTEDYKHLANQYALHLYDSVPVIDRDADIVATARMTEYAYDAILDEYQDTGLGELEEVKSTIYGYELAAGSVSGGKLIPNTVHGDRLQNLSVSYGKFDLAAIKQLSADAITAIRADIRELVAGNITTDQLYADIAVIAAAQITAANIDKANIKWAEIESLTAEIAKIVNAEIGHAEIDTAQIKNLSAAVATIVKAEIAIAEIDWAHIKNVEVDTAQIKLGAITQALIAAGAIGTAQIADGSITSAKIVELTADLIKTGTLSAERLLIRGAGGLFYEINAQAGGLTAAQLTEEQYKNAISGTALVARSVTAAQIAAKTITANEILSGTITAAEINVANLFAAEATIAALDSYIMRTATIEALKGSLDIWATDKINLAVKDVQIGGRNLLRGTKPMDLSRFGFDSSGAATMGTYEAYDGGLHVINTQSNLRVWLNGQIPVSAGQNITVSFKYSMWGGDSPVQLQANWYRSANDMAPGYADSIEHFPQTMTMVDGGWGWVRATFVVPDYAAFAAFAFRSGQDFELYDCEYIVREFKAELGNRATDWSPAPEDTNGAIDAVSAELLVESKRITAEVARATEAEGVLSGRIETTSQSIMLEVSKKQNVGDPAAGVDTGESSRVRMKVTSEEFDVDVPGEDGDFRLNETGGWLPVLISDMVKANNIVYRYDGAANVFVNPNATNDQIASGSYFRSLSDVFSKINGRMINADELNVYMQGNDYGTAVLQRMTGGVLRIYGNGASLTGELDFIDCSCRIYVESLNVTASGGNQAALATGKGSWVCWHGCTLNGNGAGYVLRFVDGAGGMVWDCGLYNAANLIYAGHACDVSNILIRGGNCTNFAATDGCTIKFSETRPDGAWAQHNASMVVPSDPTTAPVDYGTAQPSIPAIQTAVYDYLYTDSYASGWNAFEDDDARQGYNGQRIYGVIWFDAAAIRSALSGRTVNQASLRLYMHDNVGRGVGVSVQLYGTDKEYAGRSGAPALTASYGTIGTAQPGEANEITIPAQAVYDMVSGAAQALVLLSDDTEMYKDRNYSKNYARFSGTTSADENSCPRLTVVYQ